ncbi:MAG TPA: hypothetical protein VFH88_09860, partial [Candidatus Krumholzibacteria bacterium]|nr:hypothetical protein [Candidatus Krumholzibacteria bacterium]
VSSRMLEMARTLARERNVDERCTFQQIDVLGMDGAQRFDHAVATGFWDYVLDPLPVMGALSAQVQNRLAASFPARSAFRVPFRALWLYARRCPVRFYSEAEINGLCRDSGFEVRMLRRSGPMYLLHAQRRR